MLNRETVIAQAEGIFEEIRQARRQLHMYPELGREELKTQALIMDFLAREGIPHQPCADTGVVATVDGQPGGRVIAMRADIDALPIQETGDVDYKSRHDGIMHACGHDAHTAINMGAAKLLNMNRAHFKGTVKFFFQPAEERDGGAKRMIAEGCMENPRVEAVIGLHVMPNFNYNQIQYKYGVLNAAADSMKIKVTGKRGHGAYPDRCVDAIVIAAHVITALQSVVSRSISPLESAVFTAGTIHGGDASNIIADQVEISGTIRSSTPEVRAMMHERICETAEGVAKSMGGGCEVWISPDGYLPLINNTQVLEAVLAEAEDYIGRENMFEKPIMSMGGEDFSFFSENAPGAFYNLGCRVQARQEEYFLHTAAFDIDERCLVTGMVLEVMSGLRLMGN